MRGDRPILCAIPARTISFTPHARGSTWFFLLRKAFWQVYPACAGIDLDKVKSEIKRLGLPRMRGDRPKGG